jgi:hypothetical protein
VSSPPVVLPPAAHFVQLPSPALKYPFGQSSARQAAGGNVIGQSATCTAALHSSNMHGSMAKQRGATSALRVAASKAMCRLHLRYLALSQPVPGRGSEIDAVCSAATAEGGDARVDGSCDGHTTGDRWRQQAGPPNRDRQLLIEAAVCSAACQANHWSRGEIPHAQLLTSSGAC